MLNHSLFHKAYISIQSRAKGTLNTFTKTSGVLEFPMGKVTYSVNCFLSSEAQSLADRCRPSFTGPRSIFPSFIPKQACSNTQSDGIKINLFDVEVTACNSQQWYSLLLVNSFLSQTHVCTLLNAVRIFFQSTLQAFLVSKQAPLYKPQYSGLHLSTAVLLSYQ